MLYSEAERGYTECLVREASWTAGDLVRKLRGVSGLKLEQLAARAGVSLSAIHELEVGTTAEPKRATLTKIAAVFGLTLREFEDLIPNRPVKFELAQSEKLRKRG